MKNIFEMIKKDIEEEFSILKNSASFLRIPKITVFDLKSGELQMDTYLPVSITSLQELPKFSISKFTSKLHSYFPKYRNKMGSLSEYIPDSDASNWVPPFKGKFNIYHFCFLCKGEFLKINNCYAIETIKLRLLYFSCCLFKRRPLHNLWWQGIWFLRKMFLRFDTWLYWRKLLDHHKLP